MGDSEVTVVVGWSELNSSVIDLSESMGRAFPLRLVSNARGRYKNIFEFLDSGEGSSGTSALIIQEGLLVFSTEGNIRSVLARLVAEGSSKSLAYVIERIAHRNFPALLRAVRCLGLEHLCEIELKEGWCVLRIQRGAALDQSAWKRAVPEYGVHTDAKHIALMIGRACDEGSGFSLLRFGHCESKFVGWGTHFGWSDLMQSSMLQWGAEINATTAFELQARISIATLSTDVIGIKTRKRFGAGKLDILNSAAMAVAVDRGVIRKDVLRADSNIHYDLACQHEFVSCIARAKRVVVVSPREQAIASILRAVPMCSDIEYVSVPGEFRVNSEGGDDIVHRFGLFDIAEKRIKQLAAPGVLFLIGAGLVGKYWCALAKMGGGAAVDLGSVLDAWGGVNSRTGGFPERVTALIKPISNQ